MEFEEYLSKCRFCLRDIDAASDCCQISETIKQEFYDLTQIYLDLSQDEYSTVVCEKCKINLQIFNTMRQEFIRNQKKLDEIIQNAKIKMEMSQEIKIEPLDMILDDDSFGEEIIEYIDDFPDKMDDVKTEIPESLMHPCRFCKLKFSGIKLLENHCINKHKKLLSKEEIRQFRKRRIDDRKLVCPRCGIRTHYLKEHMQRTHLNIKRFFCDLCGHKAFHKSELVIHMLKHKESVLVCDYCGKKVRRKSALKLHIKRIHLGIVDTKKYKRKGPLNPSNKKKNIGDESTTRCHFCEKIVLASYLKAHIEQVHTISETKEICPICEKPFKNKRALMYHKRNHKERIYKCTYPNCTKAFFMESRLARHQDVHKNIREYKCQHDGCDKSYFIRRVLNMHIALHHEKFTMNCPVSGCNFSVGRKDYMRNHVSKQHKNSAPDTLNYYLEQVKEMPLW